ncbi:hypothetical protein ACPXCE_17645 [Streptomyces sp. DT24]|uniref:hypothetical protein n=1 Tax=Streptomyces sp. DT24 TaxID=3416520 RepID=UPI003CF27D83
MNSTDGQAQDSSQDSARSGKESRDVTVSLSGCAEGDAQTVFAVLSTSFASDRAPEDVPHEESRSHPTVWAATVDVSRTKAVAGPATLSAPVTVEAQGGYWAVDRLRQHLADAFTVRVIGTAAGDQEQEVRLRLESR